MISGNGLYDEVPLCPYCSSNGAVQFQSITDRGIHWYCDHTHSQSEDYRFFKTPPESYFKRCPFCFGTGVIIPHVNKSYMTCPDCQGRKWLKA